MWLNVANVADVWVVEGKIWMSERQKEEVRDRILYAVGILHVSTPLL